MSRRNSREEYDRLCRMISRWNDKRVELFEISMPNQGLEFEGVMKFYYQYQDIQGQKVATKCIRVSNTATVQDIIEVLVQKFRPDLRMLPNLASYALYEVHNDKEERRMDPQEKPLLTMLKWSSKDIDGRFLLRNELKFSLHSKLVQGKKSPQIKKKKSPKIDRKKNRYVRTPTDIVITDGSDIDSEKGHIARSLYTDYPPSHVTRSITSPDIARNYTNIGGGGGGGMRTKSKLGSEDLSDGNCIPISLDTVAPDTPVKSFLASKSDTAAQLVKSAVEKFGIGYNLEDYCLVQVIIPSVEGPHSLGKLNVRERILEDGESPVRLHLNHVSTTDANSSVMQFHLRRRDSFNEKFDYNIASYRDLGLPFLMEIPDVSATSAHPPPCYYLSASSTEIGSQFPSLETDKYICLRYHGICPRHCLIAKSRANVFNVSLLDPNALVRINGDLVEDTRVLTSGSVLLLGDRQQFRFVVPSSFHIRSNSALHSSGQTVLQEPFNRKLSKAFSSDDLGHSVHQGYRLDLSNTRMKSRTVSEHTLKGDGGGIEDSVIPSKDSAGDIMDTSSESSPKKRRNSSGVSNGRQAVLPASVSFLQSDATHLLQCLIANIDGSRLQFKLAPAYAIYMIARHHLSSEFSVDINHHSSLIHMLKSTCSLLKRAVKESKNVAGPLAFWLSNTSELLHFLRRDYQLYMYAHEYENMLTSIIHMAYKHFTECMIREISLYLPAFLSDSVDSEEVTPPSQPIPEREVSSQEPDVVAISHASAHPSLYWLKGGAKTSRTITVKSLLLTLSGTLSLLHLCKVNRTLSILIFNLLFRYISMRLFNKLVTESRYCTRSIGSLLLSRLDKLKAWARTESLNLPADEHLAVIYQAAKLLSHDLKNVHADHLNIYSLNSCQVKTLLHNIEENEGKETVSSSLVDKLLTNAYNDVDQKLMADGQDVYLQEDPNLELPFLIPEHGYSCDTMRGVPVGLEEYLETAIVSGLCQLTVTKDSLGCWIPPRVTTSKQRESPLSTQASTQMSQTLPRNFPYSPYTSEQKACRPKSSMDIPDGNESNIISVTLSACGNKSLGINFSVLKDSRGVSGYFIKSLLRDGIASEDGRLQPGDQILQINNTAITGLSSDLVEKLLHSSHSELTIVISTSGHSLSDSQPQIPTKLPPQSQNETFPPPKEGSSHAMKAARRELRRQQQTPSRQSYDYHHQQQLYSPVVPQLPTHMTKWLQEQREISQQKPSGYHRTSIPQGVSHSMSSLIPEQDESAERTVAHYRVTTPSGSDVSDNQSTAIRGPYSKIMTPTSSKQPLSVLPGHQSRSRSDFMSGFNDGSYTDDLSNTSHSQTPFKDMLSNSLSGQTSEVDNSQSYPSLAREKLSMEVGYHTQLSSTGLSVSSVLDHLPKKGKKGGIGLQLQGLEVDEIELEKQRMQLLFYRQQKERKDQLDPSTTAVDDSQQGATDAWPPSSEQQYDGKGQGDEEDLLVEPEKLLQVAKIKQDLEYVRKMINDQRKRCRELQFAKERGEQSLNQAELRFKSQNRHFMPFMRPEDEMRWQRDQKRKLKEWERFSAEKKNELHHIEVKEIEAKTRLRALEQHASDLKKQLATCETQMSSRDIPERDWGNRGSNNIRPIRVTSTESITTGSSWVSSENIPRDTTSIGSDIPEFQFGSIIRGSSLDCHSDSSSPKPFQPQWHPRHPEFHGSCESPTLMHNSDVAFNVKTPKARISSEQEERVRLLKEEHTHHLSSLENIPSRSAKDKEIQVHHLKQEVRRLQDTPVYTGGGLGGYDSRESSLSSSTPDVVPVMYAPPLTARLLSSDNKSDHHRPSSSSSIPNYSRPSFQSQQQSLLKSRSRDELSRDIPERQQQQQSIEQHSGLLGGGDMQQRYQYPEQDSRSNRKVPKSGGPHSYSRGRPEPPSSDDRSSRGRLSGTPQLTTRYVQRQQTEL